MSWDPRDALAADESVMRGLDPLERARRTMAAGDVAEQAEADERRAAAHEAFVGRMRQQQMLDRVELARTGHLQREVQALHAEQQAIRQHRVMELRQELDKLTGGSGEALPVHMPSPLDVELAQHRRGAEQWSSGPCRRQRELALVQELEREAGRQGPVIRRVGPAPEPRPLPVLVLPGLLRRAGAPATGDF